MHTKRIIPCLDVKDGRVVKGVNFVDLRDAGDPVEIGEAYDKAGADELVFLDITASSDARSTVVDMVRRVAKTVFIPFTVGGGIRTVDDFRALLREGADKISINSSAINTPRLISDAAEKFGSQCVVVAIDAKRRTDNSGWNIYKNGGRIDVGIDQLFRGSVHTFAWINPLQSVRTGITSEPIIKNGETIFSLRDSSARSTSGKPMVVFRPDTPHNGFPYTHINAVEGRSIKTGQYVPSSELQISNLNSINHKEISEDAYRVLKDFDGTAKKVRIGARVLLVIGAALEALELYQTVEPDLHDADRKIGKKTYSHVASIVGSWSLSAFLSAKGAAAGAALGTAIMPGVGTAVGGVVGSVTLGLVGSFGGSSLGKWIVDITATE